MNELVRLPGYRSSLAEGPLWHAGQFYWVDIEQRSIFTADTESVRLVRTFSFQVTALVPCSGTGFLLASERGVFFIDSFDGELQWIGDPEKDDPRTRLNDGKCDPQGRFWVGSMGFKSEPGIASLYCFGADHSCRQMLEAVTISNGLAWSLDGSTLYFIDSPTRLIRAFPFDGKSGELGPGSIVITIPEGEGYPDGMTIDCLGRLWIALWDGSKVACYEPQSGREVDRILLPVTRPTSCAFGGLNMDELLITTASFGLDDAALAVQPDAGSVFKIRLDARGLQASAFAGSLFARDGQTQLYSQEA